MRFLLLRLLLRSLANFGTERVEMCLLLVTERTIELLERRPNDLHRLERGADAVRHRAQAAGWCQRIGIAAGLLERIGSLCRRGLQIVEQAALLGRRPDRLCDRREWPGGHALVRSVTQLP